MSDRPSFNMNKIGKYNVGPTGITGTSDSATQPRNSSVEFSEGKYNSSNLLFENIDKLGATLFNKKAEDTIDDSYYQQEEVDQHNNEEEVEDNFDLLSEEEIAKNLDYHINYNKRNNKTAQIQTSSVPSQQNSSDSDKFCRNCGQKFLNNDNFCGNCGTQRNKAN